MTTKKESYGHEEYLHRRIADLLHNSLKLEEDLNRSEAEVSVVLATLFEAQKP